MNVLVSVDDNYFKPLTVMLTSLMENNNWCTTKVFLLHRNLSPENLKKLNELISSYGNEFFGIKVNPELLSGVNLKNQLPAETYFRLLAAEYLPEYIEKILYLDADIVVDGSLEHFYSTDFAGHLFVGVPDFGVMHWYRDTNRRLGLPQDYPYINAGVLLMNVKALRKEINLEQLCNFIADNTETLLWSDQDVINMLYHDKIKQTSPCYNYQARYYRYGDILAHPVQRALKKRTIIHYVCPTKPWQEEYYGKYGNRYNHYAKKAGLKIQKHKNPLSHYKLVQKKVKTDIEAFKQPLS